MKLKRAIEILEKFNQWRQGEDNEMEHPAKVGKAIDTVVDFYKEQTETE